MEVIFHTSALIALLLGSAYCSASETALFSLPATRLRSYKNSHDPRKNLVSTLLSRPRDLLVTVFLLNTLVNILLQNYISALFGESASWLLKVGVPLFLMLILGELIPKYIGIRINLSLASAVAPSINWIHRAISPIRKLIKTTCDPSDTCKNRR